MIGTCPGWDGSTEDSSGSKWQDPNVCKRRPKVYGLIESTWGTGRGRMWAERMQGGEELHGVCGDPWELGWLEHKVQKVMEVPTGHIMVGASLKCQAMHLDVIWQATGNCGGRETVVKERKEGTSLVIQWLRFWAPSAEDLGLSPGRGTRFYMLQLRPGAVKVNKHINFF